jgi:hypothetical protein
MIGFGGGGKCSIRLKTLSLTQHAANSGGEMCLLQSSPRCLTCFVAQAQAELPALPPLIEAQVEDEPAAGCCS